MNIWKPKSAPTCIFYLILLFAAVGSVYSQTSYTTGFETPTFTLGDVNGQNGWGYLSNSPTKGIIEGAPPNMFGTQSLAIRTNNVAFFGVSNHLFSATIDPAGETGSTIGGTAVAAPYNHYSASLYYQAPSTPVISTRVDGRFAELNPSSKGPNFTDPANRYAQVRLINNTNTGAGTIRVEMGWYTLSTSAFSVVTVADNLNWGETYRFEYSISFCDGLRPNGSANDIFTLSIYNSSNTLLGTATGSTWETAYKTGTFGGGTTPRAVNGFDLWTQTGPNNMLVGYIDNFSQSVDNVANPCQTLTAAHVSLGGRVTAGKTGVSGARVYLSGQTGGPRLAITNSFGFFRFDDVQVGESYVIDVQSKRYTFAPRAVTVNDELLDLNFNAESRF